MSKNKGFFFELFKIQKYKFRRPFFCKKMLFYFQTIYFLKLCPIFLDSALVLFTKYNNFLGICSVLALNLKFSSFVGKCFLKYGISFQKVTTSFSSDTDVARRRFFYVRNRNWSAIDVLKRDHPYITSARDWVDEF